MREEIVQINIWLNQFYYKKIDLILILKKVGLVFAALINSTSRNPALRPQLFSYTILG